MPYIIKKVSDGWKVCLKLNPEKCFSNHGISKKKAIAQIKAIGLNSHKKK